MGMVEPYEPEGRRIVDPGWESSRRLTFSPAAGKKGEVVFVSGLNAIAEDGVLAAPGDVAGQAAAIYRKLGEILATAGAGPGDVVKTTDYILSRDGYQETAAVRRDFFGDEFPAAAGVVVAGLLGQGVLIEIEAVFVI